MRRGGGDLQQLEDVIPHVQVGKLGVQRLQGESDTCRHEGDTWRYNVCRPVQGSTLRSEIIPDIRRSAPCTRGQKG